MANLKEIRTRIASVTTTRQITSAMKMVSAAKLKRAQDAVLQLRPYVSKLSAILGNLYLYNDGYEDKLFFHTRSRGNGAVLIVLITSNRGLCGAFNNNAIKLALSLAHNEFGSQLKSKQLKFIGIGKKGADYLRSKKYPLLAEFPEIVERPNIETVSNFAEKIIGEYLEGKFDKIILVYNQFKNAAVQELVWEQFLPLSPVVRKKEIKKPVVTYENDYILEPSKAAIIAEVVPIYLKTLLFRAVLDSVASEHGARMTAMHKATDNATELLRQLTLNYNKARQASITGEILEIVGGAEALKG